jgi:polysaccharide biosynthesis protein PslH
MSTQLQRWLVVTPVATHPTTQGNSARIVALCTALRTLGHQVHLLYFALEGITPAQHLEMALAWDGLDVLAPPPRATTSAAAADGAMGIDDWYHPVLGQRAAALHRHLPFDAVLVNYVWMSAVFEALPRDVLRVLDTHDVFGNRAERFAAIGLRAQWFYTSVKEERRGLARADRVIAIQQEEAEVLRGRVHGLGIEVLTLGHLLPRRFVPPRDGPARPRVGYVGSGNPFNVAALRWLAAALADDAALAAACEFHVAGAVGAGLAGTAHPFVLHGVLDDLGAFYAGMDLAINPMPGGSGLKIKTLEALSFGLAVLGTVDAWSGLVSTSADIPHAPRFDPLDALRHLLSHDAVLPALRDRCRQLFVRDQQRQHQAFRSLLSHP